MIVSPFFDIDASKLSLFAWEFAGASGARKFIVATVDGRLFCLPSWPFIQLHLTLSKLCRSLAKVSGHTTALWTVLPNISTKSFAKGKVSGIVSEQALDTYPVCRGLRRPFF